MFLFIEKERKVEWYFTRDGQRSVLVVVSARRGLLIQVLLVCLLLLLLLLSGRGVHGCVASVVHSSNNRLRAVTVRSPSLRRHVVSTTEHDLAAAVAFNNLLLPRSMLQG